MKINAKVVGTANVLANISYWQRVKFKKEIKNALNLTAKKIENSAIQFAPKKTGALKASMWSKMVSDTEAQIGDGVFYGYWQEIGTSRFPAQPFLRPALTANKKEFEKYMKDVLR